mmetsp:Transcript_29924/g.73348  ORF Transcript_29924/g.73348 Transcript_29924/m.73348 type:complete len:158 (-) Transcript_29924:118-591(-)|eukprot:CAMPEP_0114115262 /NCGR_PEP_ID=MMETSP0043_2-20121206/3877_1 /TAXON_ID=464988 /ORGANISM="Hemiselmis andersenii, Strain CCMP644" /LENGTH=157 /DNA_ID=CAMNT_0001207517 /DNA_START=85 /DNA_END=558 /DNA_ORIENTATION=-
MECLACCSSRAPQRPGGSGQPRGSGALGEGPQRPVIPVSGTSKAYSHMVPASGNPLVASPVGADKEPMSLRLTCFDESDVEVRQLVIKRTLLWKDMKLLLTDILGKPAMMAYDNGVGVDLPVKTEQDWEMFLMMLERETVLNREYDILVLPEGSFKG